MASPCQPPIPPPFGYLCENEVGDPVVDEAVTVDGIRVVQGPLRFCGTGEQVCLDDTVSSCISDSDGAPTVYGPLPAAPDPENVTGRSPIMSRLRINRTGQAVFPYSVANRPDQLLDIVFDDGEEGTTEVPFNATTGRFTLPPYPVVPVIPDRMLYHDIVEAEEKNEAGPLLADIRHATDEGTITNPHDELPMRVIVQVTTQVGFSLTNATGGSKQASIAPELWYDDTGWLGATWQETPRQNHDPDNGVTDGCTITFDDSFVLDPLESRQFAVGLTVVNVVPLSVLSVGPLSLKIACFGRNFDEVPP